MPICPQCGKKFSGFSIGSQAPTMCRDCRKKSTQVSPETSEKIMKEVRDKLSWQVGPPAMTPRVTYILMGLNAAVYVAMGLSGVSWTNPNVMDAIRWGADFGPLTLNGQWWRLLTSTFVHFGIVHILLNMWCLWDLGRSLEPWLGHKAFALMYLACGMAASLVSVTWNPWRASAGASGAVFGVAGAFASYLYLKKAPMDPGTIQKKLKSLGTFILYNLLYGARAGVDNSAHIGGLLAGLIIGALLPEFVAEIRGTGVLPVAARPEISASPIDRASNGEQHARQLALVAIVSIAVLFGAGVHAYVSNMPAVHYGEAVNALKHGDVGAAIDRLTKVVSAKPDLLLAQELLAECQLNAGQPLLALPPLEKALELSPKSKWVQTNLALAYLGAGQPNDAIARMTRVFADANERSWWGTFIIGMAQDQLGNYPAAVMNLGAAFKANPELAEAGEALARVDLELGLLADARAVYAEILKGNPDDMAAREQALILADASGSQEAASRVPVVKIPYSKLVAKSPAWPLFP